MTSLASPDDDGRADGVDATAVEAVELLDGEEEAVWLAAAGEAVGLVPPDVSGDRCIWAYTSPPSVKVATSRDASSSARPIVLQNLNLGRRYFTVPISDRTPDASLRRQLAFPLPERVPWKHSARVVNLARHWRVGVGLCTLEGRWLTTMTGRAYFMNRRGVIVSAAPRITVWS